MSPNAGTAVNKLSSAKTIFIQTLELQTGKTLTPKRPGPKPSSTN